MDLDIVRLVPMVTKMIEPNLEQLSKALYGQTTNAENEFTGENEFERQS